jgi:hypothetical protein
MNIETVLLIVIVTFACGFVLDRWNVRLSRSRRRQAVRQKLEPTPKNDPEAPPWQAHCAQQA